MPQVLISIQGIILVRKHCSGFSAYSLNPDARRLPQVLIASGPGDAFRNIGAQLEDGHWVLAFSNVEDAHYATLMVDQHAAKLRAFYCAVCTPPPFPRPRSALAQLAADQCRGH